MTPGIVFSAPMIISTSARHQLSVTVHFPGLSEAGEVSRAAFHILVALERNCLHLPGYWILTAVLCQRFWKELVFQVPFRRCHLQWEFPFCSRGDNQCSELQSRKRKLVCILIHMACFGKCDFTPPPTSSLLLAMALMEVLCPMLSILEKLLGSAQIPQLSRLLESCSWLGVPGGPFCYDSRTNQSQLR